MELKQFCSHVLFFSHTCLFCCYYSCTNRKLPTSAVLMRLSTQMYILFFKNLNNKTSAASKRESERLTCSCAHHIYFAPTMNWSKNIPSWTNRIPIESQRRPLRSMCFIFSLALYCKSPGKVLVFKELTPVSSNVPISIQGLWLYAIGPVLAGDLTVRSLTDKIFVHLMGQKTVIFFAGLCYFYSIKLQIRQTSETQFVQEQECT